MGSPHRRAAFSLFPAAVFLAALPFGASCGGSTEDSEPAGRELGDGFADVKTVIYPPLEIPEDAPTVLFLGDSITAGLHLSPDQAFPAAVQRGSVEFGVPFHIVNAGASGDTTRSGLNRLANALKNSKPDLVVVELGANDGLRGQSLEATEANLREIITQVHLTGAQVLLLGMDVPTNLGDYAKDFSDMYLRISSDLDVMVVPSFLDGVGGIPEMNLPDGMHPTPEGHERLAKNIQRPLVSMLSTASPLVLPGHALPATKGHAPK